MTELKDGHDSGHMSLRSLDICAMGYVRNYYECIACCERFDVAVDVSDDHRVVLVEEWADETSFRAYRDSDLVVGRVRRAVDQGHKHGARLCEVDPGSPGHQDAPPAGPRRPGPV
ncbi:MAG: putative quinol monooxygenase [Euzebya sp.]